MPPSLWFRKHREPAAIVLPTGAGKSGDCRTGARPRTRAGAGACQRAGGAKPRQILRARHGGRHFAAGLKRKESHGKVVFGSVQSVARNTELFRSEFSLLIVDECHRISDDDDSQYQQILTHLKR